MNRRKFLKKLSVGIAITTLPASIVNFTKPSINKNVTETTRKLNGNYTIETMKDIKHMHGLSDELTIELTNQTRMEVDNEILQAIEAIV